MKIVKQNSQRDIHLLLQLAVLEYETKIYIFLLLDFSLFLITQHIEKVFKKFDLIIYHSYTYHI